MISAADFADVFPWMPKGGPGSRTGVVAGRRLRRRLEDRRAAQGRYDECLARWEDDGGRIREVPPTNVRRAGEPDGPASPDAQALAAACQAPIVPVLFLYKIAAAMCDGPRNLPRRDTGGS